MEDPPPPQPNQIQHYPAVDGDVRYLFTKTLSQDDMLLGLPLGNDKHCLAIARPLLHQIKRNGVEMEIYTPNQTTWATVLYDRVTKTFKLQKMEWLDVATKSGFNVGDTIACWSLYHPHLGPNGILSLLIQKVPNIENQGAGRQGGDAATPIVIE